MTFKLTPKLRLTIVTSALLIAVIAWIGGLIHFAETMPEDIPDNAEIEQTDAIVVLTGGSNRLQNGIDLLRDGKARKLFVTGVYQGVEVKELLGLARNAPDALECCIELDYNAADTVANAMETARWLEQQGYSSVRLVTSNYHIKRSMLEFRMAAPEATIIPHPIEPEDLVHDGWWHNGQSLKLYAREYTKYLVTSLRYGLYRLSR